MSYVRGVPDSKVRVFKMGAMKPADAEIQMDLVATGGYQMRDNALEASRVMANKVFEKKTMPDQYQFNVRLFPHQCLREHSMLSGAGADRLSAGMRKPFGRPTGRAIVTKKGTVVMTLYTKKANEAIGKEGLRRAASKLPGACAIITTEKKPAVAAAA
jgi:ribosomal protein L10e